MFFFMTSSIEKFLDLSDAEIEKRKSELRRTIPTEPGIEFLQTRAKIFDVQPWPFISYLAHYSPTELANLLHSYYDYDGGGNSQTILEGLRDKYIIYQVLNDLETEQQEKKH